MRKQSMLSIIGALGAGTAAYYLLINKENRVKLSKSVKEIVEKIQAYNQKEQRPIIDNAGIPDQAKNPDKTQMENAKMVSEGSQYGVNYYNEVKNEG